MESAPAVDAPTSAAGLGPAIEILGLSKRFGSVVALDDVSLSVEPGELISLLGASGSGKSTLLRLIAGFDQPSAGQIMLHGQEVTHLSPAERDLGMVFQNYALFPHLTVGKNIEYGLRRRRWDRERRAARVQEMLERMRLDQFADRYPHELSGGQQQRVAIARALAFSPRVLLMDEPLGALDKALRENLLGEIRRVHREFSTTIIYVTHDKEEALVLSDRIAVMNAAQLQVCDRVETLFLRPPSEFVARFVAGANIVPLTMSGESDAAAPVFVSRDDDSVMVVDARRRRHRVLMPDAARQRDTLSLAIRPASLTVVPDDDAALLQIPAVVDEVTFAGDSFQIAATVQPQGVRVGLRVALAVGRQVNDGDQVMLGADPSELVVV